MSSSRFRSLVFVGVALACAAFSVTARADSRVLLLGDEQMLSQQGDDAYTQIRALPKVSAHALYLCGAQPETFLDGKSTDCGFFDRGYDGQTKRGPTGQATSLANLLAQEKPNYVVLVTGMNPGALTTEQLQQSFRRFAGVVRKTDAKCIWVGPPPGVSRDRVVSRYYDAIQKISEEVECGVLNRDLFAQVSARVPPVAEILKEMIGLGETE